MGQSVEFGTPAANAPFFGAPSFTPEFSASCRELPIGGGDDLGRLHRYWDNLRGGAALPDRRAINPADFRFMLGRVNLIDVLPGPRYLLRLHGTTNAGTLGRIIEGRDIATLRPEAIRTLAQDHFAAAVRTRRPSLYRVDIRLGRQTASYDRLLLPFADDGADGAVTLLLTGTIYAAEFTALSRTEAFRAAHLPPLPATAAAA